MREYTAIFICILICNVFICPKSFGQTDYTYKKGKSFKSTNALSMTDTIDLTSISSPIPYKKSRPGQIQTIACPVRLPGYVRGIFFGTTGYAAYPNTCLTSRQVQRFPRPLWRVPHPSVSRISSPGPAVFQRTICFLWHRKARVHSSRKSRCRRRGSSQPKSGKTGRCRRLPLSCLFAGIPAAFPPFRSPQRGCCRPSVMAY